MNKAILGLIFNLGLLSFVSAQKDGQALIDSLLPELAKSIPDTNKVNLLNRISYLYPYINPDEGIKYGKESLELATKLSWTEGIAASSYALGGNYANKADYNNALKYDYAALKIYEQLKDRPNQALMFQYLGIVYHTSKNQPKALEYDLKALEIYRELNNKKGVASLYNNIANVYNRMGQRERVLEYNLKALHLYEEVNDKGGTARMTGNIANFYADGREFNKAMIYYFQALRRETALGNKNGVTRNMGNIGETYYELATDTSIIIKPDSLIPASRSANLSKALTYLKATIENARKTGQTEYLLAYGEVLADAYKSKNNPTDALNTFKDFIAIRDSVYDVEKFNAATRRELNYEFGKREDSIKFEKQLAEVRLTDEKKSRNREQVFYISGITLVLIFSGFIFNRWRVTQKQKKIIEIEKKRSDDLLLNILPMEVAEELKTKGRADAKQFDKVTVMFTDFKDFTLISEKLNPSELVSEIDNCFKAFDNIITRHNIEKIKTIGDSYMCVGGLPISNNTHEEDVVKAALEIQDLMNAPGEQSLSSKFRGTVRIGIHSGPVVAGIVGVKKFAYDIWGDTVNIASRMESSGEAGKINISSSTYEVVKTKFNCVHRGKIEAKNKGEIDMYFVTHSLGKG
ncbi:hypothetical protein BH11BAC1_BH11BAC1_26920 [soil metagenome]